MRILLLAVATLALSACQSAAEKRAAETGEIDATNATTEEVSKLIQIAQPKAAMTPGKWTLALRVVSTDLSALSSAARGTQEQAIKALERNSTACRTKDELKPIDLSQLEKVAGTCTYPRYQSKGGKLDAVIECKKDGAPDTVLHAVGTTGPNGFDVKLDQKTGAPGQAGYIALTLQATGKRVGACPA
ncbi:DUF3617 domain-containing protein [Sphingomonas xinjiangensis]|uniref:DUF3617 family protein n=1 Tax=Sphingomonas xinjiangensis TaxID=643568 RepID=A0A840YRK6_9SPHN|nr:DUF3617 family protein [Sphingomonas xinjiangensis]MBB5711723.1 hypothetical protein [Sphingomonas xinjiangensis]